MPSEFLEAKSAVFSKPNQQFSHTIPSFLDTNNHFSIQKIIELFDLVYILRSTNMAQNNQQQFRTAHKYLKMNFEECEKYAVSSFKYEGGKTVSRLDGKEAVNIFANVDIFIVGIVVLFIMNHI